MTLPLVHVRPGDVITAAFVNALIDQMQGLDTRLSQLEGTTPGTSAVRILNVIPSVVRVGDDLEIQGQNFGFASGTQRVYFDAVRATVFRSGSSDSRLIVQVPNVPSVVPSLAAGATVTLQVSNANTSDSRSITVLPVNQQGNVLATFAGVTPTVITPGTTTSAVFSYNANCGTLLPTQVTITPTISVANWQPLLQVTDRSGAVLPNGVLPVTPNTTTPFNISLPQLPLPAGNPSSVALTVALTGAGIDGSTDGPRTFTFGQATVQPDPTITTFTLNAAQPSGGVANNTISVATGNKVTIQLVATFTQDGVYNVTHAVTAPAAGAANWSVTPTTFAFWNKDQSPITVTGSSAAVPQTHFPAFDIVPQAGASSTGQLVFTVQRQGATVNQTAAFQLQLTS